MTDVFERLRDARPDQADLDRAWPQARRAATLERVLADRPHRTPRRRTVWLVAAAAVAAAALTPAVLDAGPASARADLHALADAAANGNGPVLAPGTYLHVKTEERRRKTALPGQGQSLDTDREVWIGWDGTTWAVDSRPSAGWREYDVFPRPALGELNNPTPEFAAGLPRHPDALRRYLDQHVSGSNSHQEALFVAVADLARSNFLPPDTLAAALEVLADVDGVDTRPVTLAGQPAVEVSYSRFFGLLGRDVLVLDRATARVVSETKSDPGGRYTLTTTLTETVDRIPDDVAAAFASHDNGERITLETPHTDAVPHQTAARPS